MGAPSQTREAQTSLKISAPWSNVTTETNLGGWEDLQATQPAGNFAENSTKDSAVRVGKEPKTYQLSDNELKKIRKDANTIIGFIQHGSDDLGNQTEIIILLDNWRSEDSHLNKELLGTPHLDKILEILEKTEFVNLQKSTGIEKLYYFLSPGKQKSLIWLLEYSNAFRDYYIRPEISYSWQWELILAQKISDHVKHKDFIAASSSLNDVNPTDLDDVSVGVVSFLSDKELDSAAESEDGRKLMVRLFDELSTISYGNDERHQHARAFQSYFKGILNKKDEKGKSTFLTRLESAGMLTIPIGSAGFLSGESYARATLQSNGKILIKVSYRVEHAKYVKNEPKNIEITGLEFEPDELIELVFVNKGNDHKVVPAAFLLHISNESDTEIISKIAKFAVAGAFLPFMLPGGAIGSVGVSLEAGAETAPLVLAAADTTAYIVGTVGLLIDSLRDGLIQDFGKPAEDFLLWWGRFEAAVSWYGIGRVVIDSPNIIKNLSQIWPELKKSIATKRAASLTPQELIELDKVLETVNTRMNKIREAANKAANDNIEHGIKSGSLGNTNPNESAAKILSLQGRAPSGTDLSKVPPGKLPVTPIRNKPPGVDPHTLPPTPGAPAQPVPTSLEEQSVLGRTGTDSVPKNQANTKRPIQMIGKEGQGANKKIPPGEVPKSDFPKNLGKEVSLPSPRNISSPSRVELDAESKISELNKRLSKLKDEENKISENGNRLLDEKRDALKKFELLKEQVKDTSKYKAQKIQQDSPELKKLRELEKKIERNSKELLDIKKDISNVSAVVEKLAPYKNLGPLREGETAGQLSDRWFKQLKNESLEEYHNRLKSMREKVEELATGPTQNIGSDFEAEYSRILKNAENDLTELKVAKEELNTAKDKFSKASGKVGVGSEGVSEEVAQAQAELTAAQAKVDKLEWGTTIGDFAEDIATKKLASKTAQKIRSLQKPGGKQGIDLVGDRSDSYLAHFEVKGTAGTRARDLSTAQSNPEPYFVDRLMDAAEHNVPKALELKKLLDSGVYKGIEHYKVDVTRINLKTQQSKFNEPSAIRFNKKAPLGEEHLTSIEQYKKLVKEWKDIGQAKFKIKYNLIEE